MGNMSSQVVASETTLREKGWTNFLRHRLQREAGGKLLRGGACVGFVYPNKPSLIYLTVIKHSCLLRKAC
jgi:hypothetical protein